MDDYHFKLSNHWKWFQAKKFCVCLYIYYFENIFTIHGYIIECNNSEYILGYNMKIKGFACMNNSRFENAVSCHILSIFGKIHVI